MFLSKNWPPIRTQKRINSKTGKEYIDYTVDTRPLFPRKTFSDIRLAENHALVERSRAKQLPVVETTEKEKLELGLAKELLKDHNISFTDVAKLYLNQVNLPKKLVKEAIKEWLEFNFKKTINHSKDKDSKADITELHYRDLRSCIRYFGDRFNDKFLNYITKEEISAWVDSLPHSKVHRRNVRSKAVNFLNWCREYGHVEKNLLEFKKIPYDRSKRRKVHILSIDECTALVSASKDGPCYAYVLLILFAGLRPLSEARRIKWHHFKDGQVQVPDECKTGRRFVKLNPLLWNIIMDLKKKKVSDSIIPSNFRTLWDEIRANAGWRPTAHLLRHRGIEKSKNWTSSKAWHQDAPRHSYASYWLPLHHSYAELSRLMGNSEQTIKKDYERELPEEDAVSFWQILDDLK